jgi:ABC-type amino acid transport substrate-binding protein
MKLLSAFKPTATGAAAAVAAAVLLTTPAHALVTTYTTVLSGAAEAPPNASLGTGMGMVVMDSDALTMRVVSSFSGLTGNVTVAHIHCCTAVGNTGTAGVATVTPTFTGFPAGVTNGSYDVTFDMTAATGSWNNAFRTNNGGTSALAFAALVAGMNSGKAYLNIHSTVFTGGEIRGFLNAVPEPGSLALVALALMGGAAATRRQRGL